MAGHTRRLAPAFVCLIILVCGRGDAAAGEVTIKPGDRIRVKRGPAPLKVGKRTLATIETGTELTALKVQGNWVKVKVKKDSNTVTGWIHSKRLGALPGKKKGGQTAARKSWPIRIEAAQIVREDDKHELSVNLSNPGPKKDVGLRVLFLAAGSGLSPKSVTDIKASGSWAMHATGTWCSTSAGLSREGESIGFLTDIRYNGDRWPGANPKNIRVPLNSSNQALSFLNQALSFSALEREGVLLIGFVKYADDGNTKVPVSNTVSIRLRPDRSKRK